MLMLLMFVFTANAQLQRRFLPESIHNVKGNSEDVTENWWGYFDGDYENISVTGIGSSAVPPINYSCAIEIEAGNPEVLGKRIKSMEYSFHRLDYIEDVKIWMSTTLPNTPEQADICCISVDKSTIKTIEKDNDVNIIEFPEPYQVRNEDLYIGYSFVVTSNEGDLCTYPIVVSYSVTKSKAFFLNWGDGWRDLGGHNYGNLALRFLLDDGGEFKIGDVNYDLNINVIDVSSTLDYILNGEPELFNKKGADVDGNGEINIVDVESIIDMILERYKAPTEQNSVLSTDAVIANVTEEGIGVDLIAEHLYRGFQMDIVLPENTEITSIDLNEKIAATHSIRYSKISDRCYRIIASSLNGSDLSGNVENLFNISVNTSDIKIENIIFATSELEEKRFENISKSDITGINNITTSPKENDNIYNVNGIKVNTDNVDRGIYIVNGKKEIIK